MTQKGFIPLIIILILGAVLIGGYLIYQKQNTSVAPTETPFITTFEECVKSSGSKVIESYPRQCESSEGKTYIEQIKGTVDTSNWQEIKTNFDFSFKCPPQWQCKLSDDNEFLHGGYVASVYTGTYIRASLAFGAIKAEGFQQSVYRHPNYKNGVEWFNDLLARNPKSIEVLPNTIKQGRPGTDERLAPLYYGFKLDELQELEIDHKKALHVKEDAYGSDRILIPLNDQDLLFIETGETNSATTLGEAIISSIKFTSSAVSR